MIVLNWLGIWVKEPAEFVPRARAKESSSQKLIKLREFLRTP
jgi:hypothetical protein